MAFYPLPEGRGLTAWYDKNGVKGSAKQLKRKKKTLRSLYRKLACFVRDLLHKLSRRLVERYDLIAAEKLRIKAMTASVKGTLENPGSNVKQKSGLNRNLLSNRISMFFTMLAYKCLWYGKKLIRINPRHTSQTCSRCGFTDSKNRVSQSGFRCLGCGFELNADHNAAINILKGISGGFLRLVSGSDQVK